MPMEISYVKLPKHIRSAAKQYIEDGYPVGHFLTEVICNNLKESFMRADDINIHRMFDIVDFFYNEAPGDCWGSKKMMEAWIEHGGQSQKHFFPIWSEGYPSIGMAVNATFHGDYRGKTFKNACAEWAGELSERWKRFNQDKLTYHGHQLFDNEVDARKAYG